MLFLLEISENFSQCAFFQNVSKLNGQGLVLFLGLFWVGQNTVEQDRKI